MKSHAKVMVEKSEFIDLRSDTVTRPSPEMYDAMSAAELGDDVYGGDPTVARLEARVAKELGFEQGLFATSGTQSNLLALLSHCDRGHEFLTGATHHINKFEGGGAAVFGGIVPGTVPVGDDGMMSLDQLQSLIKGDNVHFAQTRLICLENTYNGLALPLSYQQDVQALAQKHGLATHLDGARLYNAAVHLGAEPAKVCEGFESVSLCLSKGLGAPFGAVLCGTEAFVSRARKWRKMLGGGLRQSGLMAACAEVALDNAFQTISADHARASHLAEELARLTSLDVSFPANQTNMVFINAGHEAHAKMQAELKARGIWVSGNSPRLRLVLHKDISDLQVEKTKEVFRYAFPKLGWDSICSQGDRYND